MYFCDFRCNIFPEYTYILIPAPGILIAGQKSTTYVNLIHTFILYYLSATMVESPAPINTTRPYSAPFHYVSSGLIDRDNCYLSFAAA